MSDFKRRHFDGEIVLWAVRWYCRYPISYCDLETMRPNVAARWTTRQSIAGFSMSRRPRSRSWRVDETYIKVHGKWASLYRALDKLEHYRFLSLRDPQHQGREAIPRQGSERVEGLGAAQRPEYRQGADLRRRHHRI